MTSTNTTPAREWRSAAACRGTDPELYFPVASGGPAYERQGVSESDLLDWTPEIKAEALRIATALLSPVLPQSGPKIWAQHLDVNGNAMWAARVATRSALNLSEIATVHDNSQSPHPVHAAASTKVLVARTAKELEIAAREVVAQRG